MNNSNEKIKNDLLDLYEILYHMGKNNKVSSFFSTEVLKKMKYKPEEVKKVLNITECVIEKSRQSISNEISSIETRNQALDYFAKNLSDVFKPNISQTEKNDILKKVTLEELKYLYQIIFGIPMENKCKKMDIVYKIKDYYENEKRTADLIKNLY